MKKGTLYTIGSVIILIICFIAFVLPSTFMRDRKQDALVFGKYDGRKIAYEQGSDFTQFVSYYADLFRNQGMQIDSSNQYYVFNYAFNSTVMKYAYEGEVKKSGYTVPKSAVNRQLRNNFLDENGKFSQRLYKETSPAAVESLRDEIEGNLYTSRFYDDNFQSQSDTVGDVPLYGLKISSKELAFLENYGKTKRAFNLAAFRTSDFPEPEKIKFGQENAAKFNKFDLSVITVESKSDADKVLSRIEKGEISFEDAISEYSDKNYSNSEGKLNNSFQYQIENILSDKADIAKIAALTENQTSPVIQTANGYSLFKADGAMVAPDFTDSNLVSTVSSYISSYERSVMEDFYVTRATDFSTLVHTTDFDSACKAFDIEKTEVPSFPLNYANVSIAPTLNTSLPGLASADTNENFLKMAFTLQEKELSEPSVVGNYVVVLQYTGTETSEAEENAAEAIRAELKNYDDDSGQSAILDGPKLENNFASVYYQNLM